MKKIILIITVLCLPLFAFSNEDTSSTEHPIDEWLDTCLSDPENMNTMGMVDCIGSAKEMWDEELNNNYNTLRAMFDSDTQLALLEAERAWIEYKNKEISLIRSMSSHTQGTMYSIIFGSRILEITKQRALELGDYINIMDDQL